MQTVIWAEQHVNCLFTCDISVLMMFMYCLSRPREAMSARNCLLSSISSSTAKQTHYQYVRSTWYIKSSRMKLIHHCNSSTKSASPSWYSSLSSLGFRHAAPFWDDAAAGSSCPVARIFWSLLFSFSTSPRLKKKNWVKQEDWMCLWRNRKPYKFTHI